MRKDNDVRTPRLGVRPTRWSVLTILAGLWIGPATVVPRVHAAQLPTTGEGLYELGCASCHGLDGAGVDLERLAFDTPLPDFTDCSFAEREPDSDWISVAYHGGPARGFDRSMPAYGEAFSLDQLQLITDYMRTLCTDKRWPRGELNLPRPLVTEKAFVEDEFVYTVGVNVDGNGGWVNEALYENRFGPRTMFEIKVPFGAREISADDGWGAVGVGDVQVAIKHAVHHSIESGSIVSLGAEVALPTGGTERGVGKGVTRIEPFVAYGQLLPGNTFLQMLGGVELSTDREKVQHEAILRAVFGGSWSQGGFGRTWSPMVEILAAKELEEGSHAEWALLPQLQVSLNKRQHVLLNLGARIPINETDTRSTQLLMYLLWDWYDGDLLAGW